MLLLLWGILNTFCDLEVLNWSSINTPGENPNVFIKVGLIMSHKCLSHIMEL